MLAVLSAVQKMHLQFLILVLMEKKEAIAEFVWQIGHQHKRILE